MALAAPSIERSWNQTVLSYVCQLPYNQANPVSKRKIFVGGEGEMRGGSHVYIANLGGQVTINYESLSFYMNR